MKLATRCKEVGTVYDTYSGEGVNDCSTALRWTLEGPRAKGRPKTSWRRTVRRERGKAGWRSWAKVVAGNRGV